jgi:hypothetical protein
MKFKLFIIYFALQFTLHAQYNSGFLNFDNTGRSISINGEYEVGSNGIYNSLLNKYIYGGYIDKNLKDKSNNSMKSLNVLGVNMNYDVSTFFGRNAKYSYLVGFKDQRIFNSSFTKDFYQLVYYGNKPFLNETKNLAGSTINSLRFQELKLGFIWHKIDTTAKVGVSVSILKGQQLFYIKANEGSSLHTNSDGTELTFNSNFNMALSDTTYKKNPFAYTGVGASADIFFETPYVSNIGKGSVLTINANNIGFLHWFDNSVQYNSDSTFRFDGYHIDNLLDLKDSTLATINRDSIIKNTTNARKESFNVNIPTNLLIINKIRFSDKFILGTGFRYLFNSNFKPYFFTDLEYEFSQHFTGTMHIAYGGYSKLNVGLAFMYKSPNWFIKLGSNSIQGYISPKNTYGQGAFISIAKKFKR